jgi:hypothetical protein
VYFDAASAAICTINVRAKPMLIERFAALENSASA